MRMVERLAGAVGAEEAERLAAAHVDVDAVDRGEVAEPLDQPAGVDQRFVSHAGDPSAAGTTSHQSGVPTAAVASGPPATSSSVASTTGRRRRRARRRSGPSSVRPSTPRHPAAPPPAPPPPGSGWCAVYATERVTRVRTWSRHVTRARAAGTSPAARRPSPCSRRAPRPPRPAMTVSSRPDQVALWISCQPSRSPAGQPQPAVGGDHDAARSAAGAQASTRSSRSSGGPLLGGQLAPPSNSRTSHSPPAACSAAPGRAAPGRPARRRARRYSSLSVTGLIRCSFDLSSRDPAG